MSTADLGGRPTGATRRTARSVARVAGGRQSAPNGVWGMVLFLCAEVALFGTLFGSYYYLDFIARRWPPAGIKPPGLVAPLLAALLLLLTLVPIAAASRAAGSGRRGTAIGALGLAALLQSGYLTLQIALFSHDLAQFTPQQSAYGSIYFTLLALHHAHVAFGILLDLAVVGALAIVGLTNYWLIAVQVTALYWYVVAGVGVAVVLVQLTPSL